jgi:hypothetical protein
MTLKQQGLDYIKQLNRLQILKTNKVLACREQYCIQTKKTYCDLYNRKNKKRVHINTTVLFNHVEFNANPEQFINTADFFKNIL